MKTLREYMAEAEDEHDYVIRSTADICSPKLLPLVRLALAHYKVKKLEPGAYIPPSPSNKHFPMEPGSACYEIKLITGLPLPMQNNAALQEIGMHTRINTAHLSIEGKDGAWDATLGKMSKAEYKDGGIAAGDFDTTGNYTADDGAQKLVGTERLGSFMRELQAARKEREKDFRIREIYESFITTHLSLERALKRPILKGYWLVESFNEEGIHKISLEGPFATKPDQPAYRDDTGWREVVGEASESLKGDRTLMEISIGSMTGMNPYGRQPIETGQLGRPFQVSVTDQDHGRTYRVEVRATTEDVARDRAVRLVARENNLSIESLLATQPVPAEG